MKTALVIKAACAALMLSVAPGLAQAQIQARDGADRDGGVAAATLPDAFGEGRVSSTPAPVAAPVPSDEAPSSAPQSSAPQLSAPQSPEIQAAEKALREAIAAIQAGTPDYDAMTPGLAERVREQAAEMTPLVQGFGEIQAGGHLASQDGAEVFGVVFANAATEWMIVLNDEGKIAGLLFRPAQAAAPESESEAPADPEAED